MEPLDLEGAWITTPRIYTDRRGNFHEGFRNAEIEAATGRRLDVTQANCSVSKRGVIRGIHFSDVPPGQAKYVTCTSGAILDVIVDIRRGSPEFGRWVAAELSEGDRKAVFIEEGLGHAFAALTDEATIYYLCSTPYTPQREHGVNPLDPDIGIDWPIDIEPVLSDKDLTAPSLVVALSERRLPEYSECLALKTRLAVAGQRG
jgi:dTDP-4-dehydrorhamnose 3,5-epimerase